MKLDQKGYRNILKELTKAERELHNLRYHGGKNITESKKWYDDPDVMQNHLKEKRVLIKIKMLSEQIKNAVIIEKTNSDSTINLDDIVKLDVYSNQTFGEEMLVKLVGGLVSFDEELQEVSVNSPLGNAIYGHTVGDKIDYKVGDSLMSVLIKEKQLN